MGPTTGLRRALKENFYPHLFARGFVIDTRHQPVTTILRRRSMDRVHILDVTWDKYGRPRFSVAFASCPAGGLVIRGETHAADDVFAGWCPDVGTLQRGEGAGWMFRQDATWLQRVLGRPRLRTAEAVVDEVLALYPEVENYWSTGKVGPHLKLWHTA